MQQQTFAEGTFEVYAKRTRRAAFLADMERAVPWSELCAVIAPFYPKGEGGRPTVGLERMLRTYFLQQWFNLCDPAVEETIYDSAAMRRFVGIDLGRECAPDETTILRFRHLLEKHHLGMKLFEQVHRHLEAQGMKVARGTIVDATLISAPSSTKNRDKKRDPDMHQTKKGNQWYFGMKAHIGVDAESGLTHTLVTTPANVSDVTQAHALLHGDEKTVFGDAGYQGVEKREENRNGTVSWQVALRSAKRRALPDTESGRLCERIEKLKASVRAKVEHPFHIVKNLFGHKKARYRGLAKNTSQLMTLFGLANLLIAKRRLFALHAQGAS